ncbi:hypothetical protein QQF64_018691 [Cirrhinus molitorella]|uniref:Uncharacterized protein n=1 Tax=Cirrhinus molitorella TaxID=172907 RepID=A0ABR3LDE4_9TELE
MVDCGGVAVFLKTSDPRLQRNLSFGEFVIAFSIYRDILCQAFPERREELDLYLAMIADFNQRYRGPPPEIGLPSAIQACFQDQSPYSEKILSSHPSTPINVPVLSSYLSSHPDPSFVDFLITGLSQGFWTLAKDPSEDQADPDVVLVLKQQEIFMRKMMKQVVKETVQEVLSGEFKQMKEMIETSISVVEQLTKDIKVHAEVSDTLKKQQNATEISLHAVKEELADHDGEVNRLRERRGQSSGTMSSIIPRKKAKGTDICTFNKYYYIIRSDLSYYMQTSDLNKGSDISICSLQPACQNGDHYIGGDSYFHIIKGNSCRRVTSLMKESDSVVYNLHPSCQGGDHYFAAHGYFYIIFQKKGIYRRTTNMTKESEEFDLHPNYRDGLYYWGPPNSKQNGCYFLKPASEWGVEYCTGPDLSEEEHTAVCGVHPDVLNFLPGGYQ